MLFLAQTANENVLKGAGKTAGPINCARGEEKGDLGHTHREIHLHINPQAVKELEENLAWCRQGQQELPPANGALLRQRLVVVLPLACGPGLGQIAQASEGAALELPQTGSLGWVACTFSTPPPAGPSGLALWAEFEERPKQKRVV